MPNKDYGMFYEMHPTPAKGKDGKTLYYPRPARGQKLSMKALDDYCAKHFAMRPGEMTRALDLMVQAMGYWLSEGHRIETPIGSFAARLTTRREITHPDDVNDNDILYDGVDYQPGKLWNEEMEKWGTGFRRSHNNNTAELLADEEGLERALDRSIAALNGYTTVDFFARYSGLTNYSARKQLNKWTEGDCPKLLKTRWGQTDIYTRI